MADVQTEQTMDTTESKNEPQGGSDTEVEDNTDESEIKVGLVENINQSQMGKISKDFMKVKGSSVNSNFLFLRAGANALLPTKTPKRTKITAKQNEKGASSDNNKDNSDSNKTGNKDSKSQDDSSQHSDDSRNRDYGRRKNDYDPYYCKVCDLKLNSEQTYVTHVEGKKHQKKLSALDMSYSSRGRAVDNMQFTKIREGCKVPKVHKPNEEPHLKHSEFEKQGEPLIGLRYVSEIWPIDEDQEDIYFCALCDVTCGPNAIINHVIGFKHRLAYLKYHDAENYEDVKTMTSKKSELTSVLHAHALMLAKRDGSGRIKVEVEVEDYICEAEARFNEGHRVDVYPFDLRPGNLSYLPPDVKMRFMEETEANIRTPNFITQTMIDSLKYSIDKLRTALTTYIPSDPMLKQRIGHFIQNAEMDYMETESNLSNKLMGPYQNAPYRGPREPAPHMSSGITNMSTGMGQPRMHMATGMGSLASREMTSRMRPQMSPRAAPSGYNQRNMTPGLGPRAAQMPPALVGQFNDDYVPPYPYGKNNQQQMPSTHPEIWAPMTPNNFVQYPGTSNFGSGRPKW